MLTSDISANSDSFEILESSSDYYDVLSQQSGIEKKNEGDLEFESKRDTAVDSKRTVIVEFENVDSRLSDVPLASETKKGTISMATELHHKSDDEEDTFSSWSSVKKGLTATGDDDAASVGSSITGFDILSINGSSSLLKCSKCTFLNSPTSRVCAMCPAALTPNPCKEQDEQIALNLQRKEKSGNSACFPMLQCQEDEVAGNDISRSNKSLHLKQKTSEEEEDSGHKLGDIHPFASNIHLEVTNSCLKSGVLPLPLKSLYKHGLAFKNYVGTNNRNDNVDQPNKAAYSTANKKLKTMFHFTPKFSVDYYNICQNGLPAGIRVSEDAEAALRIQSNLDGPTASQYKHDDLEKHFIGWIVVVAVEEINGVNGQPKRTTELNQAGIATSIYTSCASGQFLPLLSFDASLRHHGMIQYLLQACSNLCNAYFLENSNNCMATRRFECHNLKAGDNKPAPRNAKQQMQLLLQQLHKAEDASKGELNKEIQIKLNIIQCIVNGDRERAASWFKKAPIDFADRSRLDIAYFAYKRKEMEAGIASKDKFNFWESFVNSVLSIETCEISPRNACSNHMKEGLLNVDSEQKQQDAKSTDCRSPGGHPVLAASNSETQRQANLINVSNAKTDGFDCTTDASSEEDKERKLLSDDGLEPEEDEKKLAAGIISKVAGTGVTATTSSIDQGKECGDQVLKFRNCEQWSEGSGSRAHIVPASQSVKSLPREIELANSDSRDEDICDSNSTTTKDALDSAMHDMDKQCDCNNRSIIQSHRHTRRWISRAFETYPVTGHSMVDLYGERGTYTGSLSENSGMPHGRGRMEYHQAGRRWYEGDWIDGRWTGRGCFCNSDGDLYQGELQEDNKHGTGTMRFADGRVFVGTYMNNELYEGKMTYLDGSTYEGGWVDGMRHGYGKIIFVDGAFYKGNFRAGEFHGHGKMTWSDQGWYEGEWSNGDMQGLGKEVRPDGTLRHDGMWIKGQPNRN